MNEKIYPLKLAHRHERYLITTLHDGSKVEFSDIRLYLSELIQNTSPDAPEIPTILPGSKIPNIDQVIYNEIWKFLDIATFLNLISTNKFFLRLNNSNTWTFFLKRDFGEEYPFSDSLAIYKSLSQFIAYDDLDCYIGAYSNIQKYIQFRRVTNPIVQYLKERYKYDFVRDIYTVGYSIVKNFGVVLDVYINYNENSCYNIVCTSNCMWLRGYSPFITTLLNTIVNLETFTDQHKAIFDALDEISVQETDRIYGNWGFRDRLMSAISEKCSDL